MDLAQQHEGRLTPQDVALRSPLTIEAGQAYLDRLASRGLCEMQYTPDGTIRYLFAGAKGATGPESHE